MKERLACALLLLSMLGCAAKPPALDSHMSKGFPVYAPSKVTNLMGAMTGDSIGDPNANHHLTYWLESEDSPEKVVAFYKEQMKTLPNAKEVPEDEKFEGALLMFRCGPPAGEGADKVQDLEVIVEKAESGAGTEFRISETLKPGLKYPD
jgi:hypothetical protein